MISLIEKKTQEKESIINEVFDKIKNADGFIVLSIEKGQLQWNRWLLEDAPTLYLLEWAKTRLMLDAGV